MAEEVKKIITVEVGKSITSVRDFKKHIEDLRGALLGLNEDSEEYAQIAEQIATDQAKLNDVMKIGKTNTDAAAGSYIELNNQLKSLRNQYKALSETERNGATGQAILQNITKLDTELKDIDQSMGQYQRNVGNYKQAFDGAFKMIASEVSKINPTLGNLLSAVQKLVPAFKGVGTAATAAGTSIKSAMASTGIGLLVVALSEIVAHWEQIATAVSKAFNLQNKYTQEVKESAKNMKDLADEAARTESHLRNLASLRGLSPVQQAEESIGRARKELNDLVDEANQFTKIENILRNSELSYQERATAFERWWSNYGRYLQNGVEDVEEARKEIEEQYRLFIANAEAISNDELPLAGPFNKIIEAFDAYDKVYTEQVENQRDVVAEREKLRDDELDKEAVQIERRLELYRQGDKQEEYLRTEQYQRERESLIQHNEDLLNLRKEFYSKLEQLRLPIGFILPNESEGDILRYLSELNDEEANQVVKEYQQTKQYLIDTNDDLKQLADEYTKDIEKINQNRAKSNTQATNAELDALIKRLENYGLTELEILENNYKREKKLLEDHHKDTTNLDKEYWDKKQALINQNVESIEADLEAAIAEIQASWEKAYQKDLQAQADSEAAALHGADMMWTINPKTHESDINLEREKEDKIYEIQKAGYERRIQLYEEHLLMLEAGSDEYLDLERQIVEAKMDLDDLGYEHAVELERRKREDVDITIKKWRDALDISQQLVSAYGQAFGAVFGAIADGAEEGTEKWKAYKLSEVYINTFAGVANAFLSAMSVQPPWLGIALGIANAATAAATGAAQIAKIKSTKVGSSSGGDYGLSGVGVSPLLNQDYDMQRMTNLSLQSDAYLPGNTQVYVLESDIQEVGNRVQVREQNATF